MRKYNIINNSLGWLCFLIAAVTYLLTIEPTASFWDCPEFITQGFKLEVGHPPGNPIFMLTARFFVTLFGGGAQTAAIAVNSMSALLSAGTILLMFWTITHLAKKLLVSPDAQTVSPVRTMVIMGAGLCGALAYTWSDTFWFSAVEGEVYAFSSFCTALVIWLIFKWENRADKPHSDRYLILIAYIIGISIAVHLLNLLCIPAIVLVIYYRKFRNTNLGGSLIALALSFVIIALILFGLVPGFIAVAQRFEIFFVNSLGMGYNTGVLAYAIITVAVFVWSIYELRRQDSAWRIKVSVLASIILSGMPFIGHGWFIPSLLIIALVIYLFFTCRKIPVRIFNIVILSIFVIFIGYSSYALLLIRSSANTPMNQNAPDNAFDLGGYLNREQYGDTPLLTGPTLTEAIPYTALAQDEYGNYIYGLPVNEYGELDIHLSPIAPAEYSDEGEVIDNNAGKTTYAKAPTTDPDAKPRYIERAKSLDPKIPDGMAMLFPRMHSSDPAHVRGYKSWSGYNSDEILQKYLQSIPNQKRQEWAEKGYVLKAELDRYLEEMMNAEIKVPVGLNGELAMYEPNAIQPSFGDNLSYFVNYQLNHMYWRYFMWNFAGRQNDYAGNGEPHLGNWISGISFIDNARLGDQSLLPTQYTDDNPGHNVFYMLPLLLGLLGIVWQAFMRHRGGAQAGIEQFWVIFFLFFMTGIAIVLYLNQTPGQPRERDYAFAGSFYAFAIWIGLGVPALFAMLKALFGTLKAKTAAKTDNAAWIAAGIACLAGILVPLQMVSQTWDDHDRSDRYVARDFGMNYLNSLDENAVIFVNGDNDTFPLWYAQEVEGVRTDVKVVNLMYLTQDWYARQVAAPSYDAEGVQYTMPEDNMNFGAIRYYCVSALDGLPYKHIDEPDSLGNLTFSETMQRVYNRGPLDINPGSLNLVKSDNPDNGTYFIPGTNISDVYIPLSHSDLIKRYGRLPADADKYEQSVYNWSIQPRKYLRTGTGSQFADLLAYDIIGTSFSNGMKRPVYFASTVGNNYYMGFSDNMYYTGMTLEVTPFSHNTDPSPVAAKGYCNIVEKFRWGGLDQGKKLYLDETIRRMITSTRLAGLQVFTELLEQPDQPAPADAIRASKNEGLPVPETYADLAANLLTMLEKHMPTDIAPYENGLEYDFAKAYAQLADETGDVKALDKATALLDELLDKNAQMIKYMTSLNDQMAIKVQSAEARNLNVALVALGLRDYAKMLQTKLSGKVIDESVAQTFDDFAPYLLNGHSDFLYLVYIEGLDPNANNLYESERQQVQSLCDMYESLGVNPTSTRNKFLKNSNISLRTWQRLMN